MINPWRLKSSADILCKQFGPRSGPRTSVGETGASSASGHVRHMVIFSM